MDAGDAAVINAAGADRASLLQVADIVGEITGRPGRLEPAGERAGDAVGTRADLRRARDLLGFTPRVPLREGLLRLWRQMPQGPVPEAETSTTAA
jgi:nucleoside-diphosphate-sugar epimerase